MRILIDIGHPGHVHYFKHVIRLMQEKGHEFFLVSRDKEVTHDLLNLYNFKYVNRGKGGNNLLVKLLYILKADVVILKASLRFKPDCFLSFCSTYSGHVSALLRKPHILLDDTEHAKFEIFMYKPFASVILTPSCYMKDLGKKQVYFDSYMEQFYLHPNYFTPNESIYEELDIQKNEKYAVVRFISWNANHDVGYNRLSLEHKIEIVNYLSKYLKVFVSAEGELPQDLESSRLTLTPEKFHDVLACSEIYVGEGGTTAAEAANLGVPSIYLNPLSMGYIEDAKKKELIFQTIEINVIKSQIDIILQKGKSSYQNNKKAFLKNKIDPVKMLVKFIEEYPKGNVTEKLGKKYIR